MGAEHHHERPNDMSAIPMILNCPGCTTRHIDVGEFATKLHHTHACQECGFVWRPAIVPTVGIRFLPGFKNVPVDAEAAADAEREVTDRQIEDALQDAINSIRLARQDRIIAQATGRPT